MSSQPRSRAIPRSAVAVLFTLIAGAAVTTMSACGEKSEILADSVYVRATPQGRPRGYFRKGDRVQIHSKVEGHKYVCVSGTNRYQQTLSGWIARSDDQGNDLLKNLDSDGQHDEAAGKLVCPGEHTTPKGYPAMWYQCHNVKNPKGAWFLYGPTDSPKPDDVIGDQVAGGRFPVGHPIGLAVFATSDEEPEGSLLRDDTRPGFVWVSKVCDRDHMNPGETVPSPRTNASEGAPGQQGWINLADIEPLDADTPLGGGNLPHLTDPAGVTESEVSGDMAHVTRHVILAPSGSVTADVHCPLTHPMPVSGGFHVQGSSERLFASMPLNWEAPTQWMDPDEQARAGWRIQVANFDAGDEHGAIVDIVCRAGGAPPVGQVKVVEQVNIDAGGGEAAATARCPQSAPIPWAGGFEMGFSPGMFLLSNTPVGWDSPTTWISTDGQSRAGWESRARDEAADPHVLKSVLVCGTEGPATTTDQIVQAGANATVLAGNGGTATAACPIDHPIPVGGGIRTKSSAEVVTVSKPISWEYPTTYGGPEWTRARWHATADNRSASEPHGLGAILFCRALRVGEKLPIGPTDVEVGSGWLYYRLENDLYGIALSGLDVKGAPILVNENGWDGDFDVAAGYVYLMVSSNLYGAPLNGPTFQGPFQLVDPNGWSGDVEMQDGLVFLMKEKKLYQAPLSGTAFSSPLIQVPGEWEGDLEVSGGHVYLAKGGSLYGAPVGGAPLTNLQSEGWSGDFEVADGFIYELRGTALYGAPINGLSMQGSLQKVYQF